MTNRPVLMSPTEFAPRTLREEGHSPHPGAVLVWLSTPDFGAYILALREQSNLSLRRAADGIGVSHPFLAKIERGQVVRPESLELLERIGLTYHARLPEVFERAGVRYAVDDPSDAPIRNALRDQLLRLLTHEHYGPDDFRESELHFISDHSAELMMALVQKAWTRGRLRTSPSIHDVLLGTADPDPDAEPEP